MKSLRDEGGTPHLCWFQTSSSTRLGFQASASGSAHLLAVTVVLPKSRQKQKCREGCSVASALCLLLRVCARHTGSAFPGCTVWGPPGIRQPPSPDQHHVLEASLHCPGKGLSLGNRRVTTGPLKPGSHASFWSAHPARL